MYLLAPFILQNFYKKVLELVQSYKDVRHFWDQNSPFVLNKFFGTNHYYWPFSLCKILKNSCNGSRIMTMLHFWAQSGPFTPKQTFFQEIIPIILIYLLVPFIVQNFLKNRIQSYEDVQFKDHFPK